MPGGPKEIRKQLDRNKLSLGLFGVNCSGGLAVTTVPERWDASWENNQKLARMADDAGLDFILPLGRWKGYGGVTDHNGSNFETLTWATGILASTSDIMAFGTYLVPDPMQARITTLFIIGIAAAEAAVFLGIAVAVFRNYQTIGVDELSKLKG